MTVAPTGKVYLPTGSAVAEATGEPLPRYGTVYDLVREVPVGLLTLAHRGGKAYSEEFD
jgi:putative transposase